MSVYEKVVRCAWLSAACIAASLLSSCAETGQDRVSIPLYVVGTEVSDPIMSQGDVPVTIERADLAFGPLYLCAGNTAGELCETARLEWLETAVVDTTSEEPQAVGDLSGVTGPVRSWMYDLSISSQLTRLDPYVLEAAEDLDDASFVFEGTAVFDGVELVISASVPVQQTDTTELGVPVIRKGTDSSFFHEVTGAEKRLTLGFDPSQWVSRLDLRSYLEDETCGTSEEAVVCQGQTELTCDADGVVDRRDCAGLEQVCIKKLGCRSSLTIEEGSEAYQSLAIALSTTGRPTFGWED